MFRSQLTALLIIVLYLMAPGAGAQAELQQNDIAGHASPHLMNAGGEGFRNETSEAHLVFTQLKSMLNSRIAGKLVLGYTRKGQPVEAFYFPGSTDKRAMVIGGMHGSELSSISVARKLLSYLEANTVIEFNVLVIPSLFPDNATAALAVREEIGTIKNIGRYTHEHCADPNRQMPWPGKSFDPGAPYDAKGRLIEPENQWLLEMIQLFNPSRIVNIHAIRDVNKAGIFADPRTDASGVALGFSMDSVLAIQMATFITQRDGWVPGNSLTARPAAIYHHDHPAAAAGTWQQRNTVGSSLPGKRGAGISLGTWASTAVDSGPFPREAIQLITMEFPGSKRPSDYTEPYLAAWCKEEVDRYAAAIFYEFLQTNSNKL